MTDMWDVIVVGSGNAAFCSALAAREKGAHVLMIEKASEHLAGGNTKYTAGAMRFAYESGADLEPLLQHPDDPRLKVTDFSSYSEQQFREDLISFNDGRPLSAEQEILVGKSLETVQWLATFDIKFEPIYARQSFKKNGRHIFWGGLTLASENEGVGLFESERDAFLNAGGEIHYDCAAVSICQQEGRVCSIETVSSSGARQEFRCRAVVLACGGFEADAEMRERYLGTHWANARVRGTPHNTGDGLRMAFDLGAKVYGFYEGCHATPMDFHMKEYGNLDIPHKDRKNYRKICYFLGVMLNSEGKRFVDEGADFRNYTYAQFGRAILEQPNHFAVQIFDAKVFDLLYAEYHFHDAHFVEADRLQDLVKKIEYIDQAAALETLNAFNSAVDDSIPFDPTIKDGRSAKAVDPPRSNWAQRLDTPPYRAYPVTCGITFTYGGLKISKHGEVIHKNDEPVAGLFASGELVGGVFFNGYPGGSGLTSGAVFGRIAGYGAARYARHNLG